MRSIDSDPEENREPQKVRSYVSSRKHPHPSKPRTNGFQQSVAQPRIYKPGDVCRNKQRFIHNSPPKNETARSREELRNYVNYSNIKPPDSSRPPSSSSPPGRLSTQSMDRRRASTPSVIEPAAKRWKSSESSSSAENPSNSGDFDKTERETLRREVSELKARVEHLTSELNKTRNTLKEEEKSHQETKQAVQDQRICFRQKINEEYRKWKTSRDGYKMMFEDLRTEHIHLQSIASGKDEEISQLQSDLRDEQDRSVQAQEEADAKLRMISMKAGEKLNELNALMEQAGQLNKDVREKLLKEKANLEEYEAKQRQVMQRELLETRLSLASLNNEKLAAVNEAHRIELKAKDDELKKLQSYFAAEIATLRTSVQDLNTGNVTPSRVKPELLSQDDRLGSRGSDPRFRARSRKASATPSENSAASTSHSEHLYATMRDDSTDQQHP